MLFEINEIMMINFIKLMRLMKLIRKIQCLDAENIRGLIYKQKFSFVFKIPNKTTQIHVKLIL